MTNNKQSSFMKEISNKPPFWYPGSKGSAVKKIERMIPGKVTEMVSPFIGAGSIELALTCRGVKVYAYDKQNLLANCWKHIISDGPKLASWCKEILNSLTREQLIEICKNDYKNTDSNFEKAGYHWLRMCLSFRGIIAKSGHLVFYEIENGNAIYITKTGKRGNNLTRFDKIEEFYNPNLIVDSADFEESLDRHPGLFAYLDPPYPEAGRNLYGGSEQLDSLFNHERLANTLSKREHPFLLSYNNREIIRDLYPKDQYDWTYQDWYQQTAQTKRVVTDEVMIRPKKYLDYFSD